LVIFILGFLSWVFAFWMTGLSLRFCRPACGKWMLSICIVNRTKQVSREKNLTAAINLFLILGFIMTFLSFIGNAYLDQAFDSFNNSVTQFNQIFRNNLNVNVNNMYPLIQTMQVDFKAAAATCLAIGPVSFTVNAFRDSILTLKLEMLTILNALDFIGNVLNMAVASKNALFYVMWLFLLFSIVGLKTFHLMKTFRRGAKTCIMAVVIVTFMFIMLGCFVFMLTASGASDVCMNPLSSAVSILPQGPQNNSAQAILQYYSTCSGPNVVGFEVNSMYAQVRTLNTSFVAAAAGPCRQPPQSNGVAQVRADLKALHTTLLQVDRWRQCRPVNAVWLSVQDTLCNQLFSGAYSLWLTMLFAAVFVYCAFLLAAIDQYERLIEFSEYLGRTPEEAVAGDAFEGVKPEDLMSNDDMLSQDGGRGRRSTLGGGGGGGGGGGSVRSFKQSDQYHGQNQLFGRPDAFRSSASQAGDVETGAAGGSGRAAALAAASAAAASASSKLNDAAKESEREAKEGAVGLGTAPATPPTPEPAPTPFFGASAGEAAVMSTPSRNPVLPSTPMLARLSTAPVPPGKDDHNNTNDGDGDDALGGEGGISLVRKASAVIKIGSLELAARERRTDGELTATGALKSPGGPTAGASPPTVRPPQVPLGPPPPAAAALDMARSPPAAAPPSSSSSSASAGKAGAVASPDVVRSPAPSHHLSPADLPSPDAVPAPSPIPPPRRSVVLLNRSSVVAARSQKSPGAAAPTTPPPYARPMMMGLPDPASGGGATGSLSQSHAVTPQVAPVSAPAPAPASQPVSEDHVPAAAATAGGDHDLAPAAPAAAAANPRPRWDTGAAFAPPVVRVPSRPPDGGGDKA